MLVLVPMLIVIVDNLVHMVEVARSIIAAVAVLMINHCKEFGPRVEHTCSTNDLMQVDATSWVVQVIAHWEKM